MKLVKMIGCFAVGSASFAVRCGRLLFEGRKMLVFFIAALAFAGSEYCAFVRQEMPTPWVHDEFSQLLAADTFAHGRITNPPHPLWKHFDTFQVLQSPSYMTKYFPAQGLILALGKKLFGHPAFGVWLSMAMMCGAICWMLQAWLPQRWVFLGCMLVILHPALGINSSFSQSYFGGAIAAFGSALFLGGLARLIRKPKVLYSLLTGFGLAVLANSRPFEGTVLAAASGIMIAYLAWKGKIRVPAKRGLLRAAVVPFSVVLVLNAGWMMYYNKCVTGHWLVSPYQEYESTHSRVPVFIFQKLRPPVNFDLEVMRSFEKEHNISQYEKYSFHDFDSAVSSVTGRLKDFADVFFPTWFFKILLVFSLAAVFSGDPRLKAVFVLLLAFSAIQTLCIWVYSQYLAPVLPLYAFLFAWGLREVFSIRINGKNKGRFLAYLLLVGVIISFFSIFQSRLDWNSRHYFWFQKRARIQAALERTGKRHLVIVRYGGIQFDEWVFNDADIDNSPVVWARSLDPESDAKLQKYFKDRTQWILEVPARGKPRLEKIAPT